jgi:hypothetical protein
MEEAERLNEATLAEMEGQRDDQFLRTAEEWSRRSPAILLATTDLRSSFLVLRCCLYDHINIRAVMVVNRH